MKFLAVLFAGVLLFYLVVRPFAVEPFMVTSVGMLPTLEGGDRVHVDKVSYRFREPERGDVVVFNSVERSTKGDRNDPVEISRVVGLPGDTVEVDDGALLVNYAYLEESYLNTRLPDTSFYGPTMVPPGHVFLMSDNRADSRDSRYFGPVPFENIEGKVFLVF